MQDELSIGVRRISNDSALAWMQGFLLAFEWVNHKADHGYTFSIDAIAKPIGVEQAIRQYFKEELAEIRLAPVADWPAEVRTLLRHWLFEFQDPTFGHLEDVRNSFSLSLESFREQFLERIIQHLQSSLTPVAVWMVDIELNGFYECYWNDVVFEEADRIIFLHFGDSD